MYNLHSTIVGCTVSPGFDFEDFKLFSDSELIEKFPSHESHIKSF